MNTSIAKNVSSRPHSFEAYDPFIISTASQSVNLILGLPLNGYVIWLILGASRETMASDFFFLNMATSELFFALSGILYLVGKYLRSFSLRIFMFSLGLLYTARPLFQCCICVEYYIGVIHPVVFLRFKPLRYRVACCCVVWLIILLSCIYNFCTSLTLLYLFLYFIQTLLFFGVMLFCCLSVLWALKRPGPGETDTGKKKSNAMKRKAFKIILIIMIFMTLNLFLYMAAIPLQCFLEVMTFLSIFLILIDIALLTGFIQPLMYLQRSKKLSCFSKVK